MAGQVRSGPSDAVLWWQTGDYQLWFLQSTGLGFVWAQAPLPAPLAGPGLGWPWSITHQLHCFMDRTAWEGVQHQYSTFTRPETLTGARSPSWEGWEPGASALDWSLHLPRAPTLFLSDEIKFFNITIQPHVEGSAQDQDSHGTTHRCMVSPAWRTRAEQRARPAAWGCLDTRGSLLISVEENEDEGQSLKGDWRDTWWTFGSSERVGLGCVGTAPLGSHIVWTGLGESSPNHPQALQGVGQGEETECLTPSHDWRGFSFYIFIDQTEICIKSDFFLASSGWVFFPQMSLFSIRVRTAGRKETAWSGQREPQDSSGSELRTQRDFLLHLSWWGLVNLTEFPPLFLLKQYAKQTDGQTFWVIWLSCSGLWVGWVPSCCFCTRRFSRWNRQGQVHPNW